MVFTIVNVMNVFESKTLSTLKRIISWLHRLLLAVQCLRVERGLQSMLAPEFLVPRPSSQGACAQQLQPAGLVALSWVGSELPDQESCPHPPYWKTEAPPLDH